MAHDPERVERNAEIRRRGGQGKSNRAKARKELLEAGAATADEVLAVVVVTMRRTSSGAVKPAVGSAIASLARAWFAGRQILELEAMAARLDALERAGKGPTP